MRFAVRGGGAVAALAVGEAEEAGPAGGAGAPDDVRLALALAAELVALEAQRAGVVAAAGQRAVVIAGRDREHGVAAEARLCGVDVEVVVAARGDELVGAVQVQLLEHGRAVQVGGRHQQVVEQHAATAGSLQS